MTGRRRMRRIAAGPLCAALFAAAGLAPARAHDQVPGRAQDAPVLLRGGDLYTVSHGVLPATDLLFAGGKIVGIGRDLAAPAGAEVVDVSGKRVYPGLIAAATGIGLTEIGAVRATRDSVEVGDVTPEVAAHTAYNPDSEIIPTVRSNGITTVQVAPGGSLLRGRAFLVHLDGWTKEDAGVRLLDGMYLSWPRAAVSTSPWVRESPEEQKKAMAERRRELRRLFDDARAYGAARAADPDLPVDLRFAALQPVLAREQPLYVDADDFRQIAEAVAFAAEQELRMVLVGGREAHLAADLLKAADVPVILGSTQETPYRDDDDYDLAFRLPALLEEAGLRWCQAHISWGGWQARNLGFQAGQAIAFGLPEDVALRSVTLSAAEILGIADRQGSLEVGKDATLVVSDGDVLDSMEGGVRRMWIEGRAVDLDDRHKTLWRKYRHRLE